MGYLRSANMETREEVAGKYKKEELNYRADGRLEWICKHGVGHTIWYPKEMGKAGGVHGCDGCCTKPSLPHAKDVEFPSRVE